MISSVAASVSGVDMLLALAKPWFGALPNIMTPGISGYLALTLRIVEFSRLGVQAFGFNALAPSMKPARAPSWSGQNEFVMQCTLGIESKRAQEVVAGGK